jgi:hypothetical protein
LRAREFCFSFESRTRFASRLALAVL